MRELTGIKSEKSVNVGACCAGKGRERRRRRWVALEDDGRRELRERGGMAVKFEREDGRRLRSRHPDDNGTRRQWRRCDGDNGGDETSAVEKMKPIINERKERRRD
ncbi:MAG: hypothetical protein EOP45_04270 [Sphingobacteriaceae bacterium]|nr:MAG: hypothetical protein EOP45_04270 [Sphingobacteriaceae bacterium]